MHCLVLFDQAILPTRLTGPACWTVTSSDAVIDPLRHAFSCSSHLPVVSILLNGEHYRSVPQKVVLSKHLCSPIVTGFLPVGV